MTFLEERYSLPKFTKKWAAEMRQDRLAFGAKVATAIIDGQLKSEYPFPKFEGRGKRRVTAEITAHIKRLAAGDEQPEWDGPLLHVWLRRTDVERWLQSIDKQLPRFWGGGEATIEAQPASPAPPIAGGGARRDDAYRNLQKVVAVLALVLVGRAPRYVRAGQPNVAQIVAAIGDMVRADDALSARLGTRGLGASTLHERISEALRLFDSGD